VTDAPEAQLPQVIFGKELDHTWCYYYEKAELARQQGDWALVAQLGDEAQRLSYVPEESLEWIPFIEGYLRSGDIEKAEEISDQVRIFSDADRELCKFYDRLGVQSNDQEILEFAALQLNYIGCKQ